jgi:hypothetical protein
MIICYTTNSDFYDGIAALVNRGLSFTADAQDLTIELTGGY